MGNLVDKIKPREIDSMLRNSTCWLTFFMPLINVRNEANYLPFLRLLIEKNRRVLHHMSTLFSSREYIVRL